jgi:hypothetical protein
MPRPDFDRLYQRATARSLQAGVAQRLSYGMPAWHPALLSPPSYKPKEKTFKEELQAEIDEWLNI